MVQDGANAQEYKIKRFTDGQGRQAKLYVADNFISRLLGLFSKKARQFDGIELAPCHSVHTFFFHYAIDVVFLSKDGRVLKLVRNPGKNKVVSCSGAHSVVEIFSGRFQYDFNVGDTFYG